MMSTDIPQYTLHAIDTQLDQRAGRLFGNETRAAVDFLEKVTGARCMCQTKSKQCMMYSTNVAAAPNEARIQSLDALEQHLQACDPEPSCRFM